MPGFANGVYEASTKAFGNATVFLNQVFVPPRCEKTAIFVPPMNNKKANPEDEKELVTLLQTLVTQGRAVAVATCRSALAGRTECGGSHSVIVGGTRLICCGEKCETEFKVYDSSPLSPVNEAGFSWIPQSQFVRAVLLHIKENKKNFESIMGAELRDLNIEMAKVAADKTLNPKEKSQRLAAIEARIRNRRRNLVNSSTFQWIENP